MKAVTVEMYEASNGNLFESEEAALKYEKVLEVAEKSKKAEKLKEKIESLLPKFTELFWDTEFQKIVDNIPSHFEYQVDLRCDFSGIPLRVYKTKFHDSGHQYEKSYSERLECLLWRDFKIVEIGDITRTYSADEYERVIVPIIEQNKALFRKYLLYHFTGVL